MIKAIIFDFDGVLLNSIGIKMPAYYPLFENIPGSIDVMKEPLDVHGKQHRTEVIRQCILTFIEKGLVSESELDKLDDYTVRYGELVKKKLFTCGLFDGVIEMLENLKDRFLLFIVTSGPVKELEEELDHYDLKKYFKAFYGGGLLSKTDNALKILKGNGLSSEEVIFVGDGDTDLKAARDLNFKFIGIINKENDFENDDSIKIKTKNNSEIFELINKLDS
jgi:phosphoglycolate phosphatase-like HAD superfamily hydrolase